MDLTVLICTWNNAKRLEITLQALSECSIPPGVEWEITLVNNNCKDNTDEIVGAYQKLLPLNYVKEPVQGLSRARNTGLNASTGEWVIFSDDDVRPCKNWIEVYWQAIRQMPERTFFGGPVESEFEGEIPENSLLQVAPCSVRGLSYGSVIRKLQHNELFISANWAVRLSDIARLGGFNVELGLNPEKKKLSTGEESDLMLRLKEEGFSGWYLPDASLLHFVPKQKCTTAHILERCLAGAEKHYANYDFRLKDWILFSRPIGLYCHLFVNYIRYRVLNGLFMEDAGAYVKYRMLAVITRQVELDLKGR